MASELNAIDPRNWEQIHQELVRLARSKGALDAEEAAWLAAAVRGSVHLRLGLGSMREYLERLFGYTPRVAKERLRVAESLQALPAMRQALNGRAAVCYALAGRSKCWRRRASSKGTPPYVEPLLASTPIASAIIVADRRSSIWRISLFLSAS